MRNPFDDFSKSLADSTVSRRESMRRLGAALAGALIAPLVVRTELASANPDNRERRRRRRGLSQKPVKGGPHQDACTTFCNKCSKTKRDQCLTACRNCNNDPKRLNGACGNYVCCGAGQSYCSGRCVDFNTDPNNCGSCGHVCGGSTPNCVNGSCTGVTCPAGQTKCGAICTNLATDNANCGACGNVCGAGTTCQNSTCQPNNCVPNCSDNWCGGDGCGGECACPAGTFCMGDGLNMCVPCDGTIC